MEAFLRYRESSTLFLQRGLHFAESPISHDTIAVYSFFKHRTRSARSEHRTLQTAIRQTTSWVDSSYEVEGVFYSMTLAMHVMGQKEWSEARLKMLRWALISAQARHIAPDGCKTYGI